MTLKGLGVFDNSCGDLSVSVVSNRRDPIGSDKRYGCSGVFDKNYGDLSVSIVSNRRDPIGSDKRYGCSGVFDKNYGDLSVSVNNHTLANQEIVLVKSLKGLESLEGLGGKRLKGLRGKRLKGLRGLGGSGVSDNSCGGSIVSGFTDRYASSNFVKRERTVRSVSIVPLGRFTRNSRNDRNPESLSIPLSRRYANATRLRKASFCASTLASDLI